MSIQASLSDGNAINLERELVANTEFTSTPGRYQASHWFKTNLYKLTHGGISGYLLSLRILIPQTEPENGISNLCFCQNSIFEYFTFHYKKPK